MRMLRAIGFLILGSLAGGVPAVQAAAPENVYDVVWQTPSKDSSGSMPLGNGSTGLNAWINPAGELEFYISRTDSWGDNARLLKVGKVRVTLDPAPPVDPFEQRLSLKDATMVVRYGEGPEAVTLRLWADANHPVIHVTVDAPRPVKATAAIELWRTGQLTLPSIEVSDVLNKDPGRRPTVVEPDTILQEQTGRIGWYHRNIKSVGPDDHSRIQDMTGYKREDPLLHRTFGAILTAPGAKRLDDTHLESPAGKRHEFSIYVDTLHPATEAEWLTMMDGHIRRVAAIDFAARRAAHEKWWAERWDRSWIVARAAGGAKASGNLDDAEVVSRAYALQRFITICSGRGAYPIKFNGSVFTVPYPGKPGDADYRRWGPGYWWQNTRLPYISLCTSGDTDLMQPLFEQYIDRFLPLNLYRTKHYFGHGGAYYIECVHFWGDVFNQSYGWKPAEERTDKLQDSGYHKWEWVAGPELAYMALDYYEHTGDENFLKQKVLPTAEAVMTFFEEHYKVDENGKLVMHPSQAVETWWDCTNPMPELAGLIAVTGRLLALDESLTTPGQRASWTAFRKKLPDLPTREVDGKRMFAPAERFAAKKNSENPELYCVFPFRLAAFNRPNAELATSALNHRWDKGNSGWRQDDIFMAYLGLADQARRNLVGRAKNFDKGSRFPAFWGPNYDWIPDQDHGGVLMKAFQAMLLQTDGRKIYLFPAWPKDWNVDFKLHAPLKTTLEGVYRDGKLAELKVTPPDRKADLVVLEAQ